MFEEYLEKLRSEGFRSFTFNQAMKELGVSENSVKSAVYRMKLAGKLISPAKGFYVIVPPEYQELGSLPAEELVPLLMEHLSVDYYAGLLTSAMYHGASHQKPARFQIFVDKKLKRTLKYGHVHIECFYKKTLKSVPVIMTSVKTGYLKIASPEVTAMDLLIHTQKSGGLHHVATVLTELADSLNPARLILFAKQIRSNVWVQRLGYILEHLEPLEEQHNREVIRTLKDYLALEKLRPVALAPDLPTVGCSHSNPWKIIENITIESDI